MSFRRRQHPRRQPGLHRPPPVAPETPAEVLERAGAGLTIEQLANVSRETLAEAPPLRKDQIARLEALTAMWMRDTRIGGPQPEDTLLYSAPKPPPPARRSAPDDSGDTTAAVPPPAVSPESLAEDPPLIEEPPDADALEEPQEAGEESPRVVRDWVSRHDERSRNFDVAAKLRARVSLQDRQWEIGPIFDQGSTPPLSLHDASGCVGMGVAAAANVFLCADLQPPLDKTDALALYARAQKLDHISGEAYAGTSVLAGMKAGQEAGLWPEYRWAFGTRDIAQAILQIGPVVIGIPWFAGMEDPDAAGVITPTGAPAGGHCMALVGIRMKAGGRPGPFFVAQQSRGAGVGLHGLVLIHHQDLTRLLAGRGEAAIPVPPAGLS